MIRVSGSTAQRFCAIWATRSLRRGDGLEAPAPDRAPQHRRPAVHRHRPSRDECGSLPTRRSVAARSSKSSTRRHTLKMPSFIMAVLIRACIWSRSPLTRRISYKNTCGDRRHRKLASTTSVQKSSEGRRSVDRVLMSALGQKPHSCLLSPCPLLAVKRTLGGSDLYVRFRPKADIAMRRRDIRF